MFFFPIGCLALILFILFLPFLFLLIFFKIVNFGFISLGFSPEATILILFFILIGSAINIPITKKNKAYLEKSYFFGIVKRRESIIEGVSINLGGAVVPLIISLYFLSKTPLEPAMIATGLMIFLCFVMSKTIPGRGIVLPALVPPVFSAIIALIVSPEFAAPIAFISGVLGTLIGADILKLRKIQKYSPGMISIGGAGVFDGIFLVGIISAFLASI